MNDIFWLTKAIELAKKAEAMGEVPVGAVLVQNNQIIGEGWNQPIMHCDPTAHAEIIALRQAAQKNQNYRLPDTTLYVTLEPCIMCAGAIIHARVKRLVYGADDPKSGAIASVFKVTQPGLLNHDVICERGILADECGQILKRFFQKQRINQSAIKNVESADKPGSVVSSHSSRLIVTN